MFSYGHLPAQSNCSGNSTQSGPSLATARSISAWAAAMLAVLSRRPWGHVIAKASDGSASFPPGSTPARVKKVCGMIPVAEHKTRIPRN